MPQSQTKYKSKKQISQEADAWAKKLFQTIGPDYTSNIKDQSARTKSLLSAQGKQAKASAKDVKEQGKQFTTAQKADATRTANLLKQMSRLDYKQVPHTEVDRSVAFSDPTIPGMPVTANVTESVTAKGPRQLTDQQKLVRVAALNKEISRLASLKEIGKDEYSPEDTEYYRDINAAKRAHIARLVAEKNSLITTTAPDDTSKVDPAANIADMTTANPDSVAAVLAQLGTTPAKIDSSKKAAADAKAKNPENFTLNQKTKFRRSWRAKNAKALNSKDPKVSTPIRLLLQQLENWEKGNGPFPDTLKNEL